MADSTERQGAHNKAICICSACASLGSGGELLFDMYHSHRAASRGEGEVGGGARKRGVRRGVDQSQRMTSEAAANLGFE